MEKCEPYQGIRSVASHDLGAVIDSVQFLMLYKQSNL